MTTEVDADTDPTSSSSDPTTNSDGTETYNGVTFNPADTRTFVLGLVAGLQFQNNTYGRCFYAAVDTVNFMDVFEQDV